MKDKNEFIKALVLQFPVVKEEILDEDYIFSINLQMGCLKRYVQDWINNDEIEKLQNIFSFLESIIEDVTEEVQNAIYIAFLSHLDFAKKTDYRRLLKGKLKSGLDDIERYHQEGSKGKAKDFLDSIK